jgi:hypothetical protein
MATATIGNTGEIGDRHDLIPIHQLAGAIARKAARFAKVRGRRIRVDRGVLEREWPEIRSGKETSSILGFAAAPAPPIALDPNRRRDAVANGTTVYVVQIPDDA